MRKFYYVASLFALMLTWACSKDSYDDSKLWEKVNSLDYRVTNLESTVSQFNSDIRSISDIVNALKNNVFVTSVVETSEGQKITFSDGKSIVIKNGKDGKDGVDGNSPFIGSNGNWWIGTTDTGVKAKGTDGRNGTDGLTPVIGANGNWWIGTTDTGVKAAGTNGKDGETPHIGSNGNWWIGTTDTGVKAAGTNGTNGKDGFTPHIGPNGNWWIGQQDTGVAASGGSGGGSTAVDVPIISIKEDGGVYYWVQILNGVTTWLTDKEGNRLPVSGKDGKDGVNGTNGTNGITPLLRIDSQGYWQVSYDGGKSYTYVTNEYGQRVSATSGAGGECNCKQFFRDVYFKDGRLYLILVDGTVLVIDFSSDGEHSRDYEDTGIPYDNTPNPIIKNPNIEIPAGIIHQIGKIKGVPVSRLTIPGISLPNGKWLDVRGTGEDGQNIWVSIDESPRGFGWEPISEESKMIADVVFVVDNSGSMNQEADAVANSIIKWANQLEAANIDLRVGCVGYSISGTINGAYDMTTTYLLSTYLNRTTGTARTVGFDGANKAMLETKASNYKTSGECGAMAIRYADANFNFRSGANRFYVNFTDEPNQPNKNTAFSVEFFKNPSNWNPEKGTIYTVYTGPENDSSQPWTDLVFEKPWLMSDYTGGQTKKYDGNATGMTLSDIQVTGAMENSFYLYFTDIRNYMNSGKTYQLKITVLTPDGAYRGERVYNINFD